jgi:hypothetical protein
MIHPFQVQPNVKTFQVSATTPIVTYVIPVFNHEYIIASTLASIFSSAKLPFDLIAIVDGSCDDSSLIIHRELCSSSCNLLSSYTIVHNPSPIFETACDNQGFRLSRTEYIIEVQADICIQERGFDVKMINVSMMRGVGSVSGRLLHPFSVIDGRFSWVKYPFFKLRSVLNPSFQCVGLMGARVFSGKPVNAEKNCYFTGETNARGPWLVRKSHLERLGYLDEEHFFLGNDDHDFNRRLFQSLGAVAAYVPVHQKSEPNHGSTRRTRSGLNLTIYDYLCSKKKGSPGFRDFMYRYRPYLSTTGVSRSLLLDAQANNGGFPVF